MYKITHIYMEVLYLMVYKKHTPISAGQIKKKTIS